METVLITRIVFSMLIIPFGMIIAAILCVVLAFYALTVHPLLALAVIAGCGAAFVGVIKWESARQKRDMPPEDRD